MDKMPSFIWKNKDSYKDYGIVINKLPPETIAEEDIEEVIVVGRDGNLTIYNNAKKSYTLPMTCTLLDFTRIDEIKVWLGGQGDLIFNWQDYKYQARLNNKIDISQSLDALGEFPLLWKVQPYKRSLDNNIVTLLAPGSIFNYGTASSKPIIKIYGTGTISLNINSTFIDLTSVVDYVTIDSEMVNCSKDTDPKNNYMNGEFPILDIGINNISWTGTVTKIEITPNWRYL